MHIIAVFVKDKAFWSRQNNYQGIIKGHLLIDFIGLNSDKKTERCMMIDGLHIMSEIDRYYNKIKQWSFVPLL